MSVDVTAVPRHDEGVPVWRKYLKLEKEFFLIFIPFLYIQGLECISYVTTTYFAGLIDETHLAGIGLGFTVSNILLISSLYGYSSVFDTYGPQIYSSDNRKSLGVLLIKCLLQGLFVFLTMLGPYLGSVHLLHFFAEKDIDQGEETDLHSAGNLSVQAVATRFILYSFAYRYVDNCVVTFYKYFVTQKHYGIIFVVSTVSLAVNILANYLLVNVMKLTILGLALAMYISRTLNLLLQIGYSFACNLKGNIAWNGFSFHIFDGWWDMMKLGLSGILGLIADIALVEVSTFLMQIAGAVDLSVLIINVNVYVLLSAFIFAHCYSVSIMGGYELGRHNKANFISVSKVSIFNAVAMAVPLALSYWLSRRRIVRLFTDNEDIIEKFVGAIWMPSTVLCLDYIHSMLSWGFLVAFGKQRFQAMVSSGLCCFVGVPLVVYIVFKTDMGVKGVFLVFLGVASTKFIVFLTRMFFLNLDEEIAAAKGRIDEFQVEDTVEHGEVGHMRLKSKTEVIANQGLEKMEAAGEFAKKVDFSKLEKRRMLTKIFLLFAFALSSSLAGALSLLFL